MSANPWFDFFFGQRYGASGSDDDGPDSEAEDAPSILAEIDAVLMYVFTRLCRVYRFAPGIADLDCLLSDSGSIN